MFEKIKYFLFLSGTMIKFSAAWPKKAWHLITFIPNPNFVNNVIISLSSLMHFVNNVIISLF